jgi:hypothetical protein
MFALSRPLSMDDALHAEHDHGREHLLTALGERIAHQRHERFGIAGRERFLFANAQGRLQRGFTRHRGIGLEAKPRFGIAFRLFLGGQLLAGLGAEVIDLALDRGTGETVRRAIAARPARRRWLQRIPRSTRPRS